MDVRSYIAGTFVVFFLQACTAEPMPTGWKTDCVGRLQISFPGDADVAARTLESWRETRNINPTNVQLRFPDEQLSFWGAHGLEITHPLEPKSLDDLYASELWTAESFKAMVKSSPRFPFDKNSFRSISAKPLDGASWAFRHRQHFYTGTAIAKVGPHFVKFEAFANDEEDKLSSTRVEPELKRFAQDLRHRPLFTVPTAPGLCYPYLFLQDSEGEPRKPSVHTTYRLKDHPDITVLLVQDEIVGAYVPERASRRNAAERQADFFWIDNYSGNYKSIAGLISPTKLHLPTKFAGRDGVESFAEITRKDNTIDWGYLVSVSGRAEGGQPQEPDMMFYVIRDSSVAKAKGIQPFGKDEKEFLKFARSIATSVKPRLTSPTPEK